MLVAFCFALCLVPLALTHKIHPAALRPAPLEPRFFIRRVPQSLTTVLVSGLVVGSFYGLAPLYANQLGLPNEQVGLYWAPASSPGCWCGGRSAGCPTVATVPG